MKTKTEHGTLLMSQKKKTNKKSPKKLLQQKPTKISIYNLGDFMNTMKFTQCYCTALGMFQLS